MLTNLRKVFGLARSSRGGHFFDLTVAGVVIDDVQPLGNWLTPGVTKAGRMSFSGFVDGHKVKIYSVFSPVQSELRQAIQSIKFENFSFPEIVCSDDNFVVESWIDADLSSAAHTKKQSAVADVIGELHAANLGMKPEWVERSPFCYFTDYLVLRLHRWRAVPEISEFITRWQQAYDLVKSSIPVRLSHPDLTARNMILCKSNGRLYVVDNELLGVGHGWILDWHNAGIPELSLANYDSDDDLKLFVELSWKLRRLGSLMDSYDYSAVKKLLAC